VQRIINIWKFLQRESNYKAVMASVAVLTLLLTGVVGIFKGVHAVVKNMNTDSVTTKPHTLNTNLSAKKEKSIVFVSNGNCAPWLSDMRRKGRRVFQGEASLSLQCVNNRQICPDALYNAKQAAKMRAVKSACEYYSFNTSDKSEIRNGKLELEIAHSDCKNQFKILEKCDEQIASDLVIVYINAIRTRDQND